jgi:hypothetical protein
MPIWSRHPIVMLHKMTGGSQGQSMVQFEERPISEKYKHFGKHDSEEFLDRIAPVGEGNRVLRKMGSPTRL